MYKVYNHKLKSSRFSSSLSLMILLIMVLGTIPLEAMAQAAKTGVQGNNEQTWYKVEICIFENTPAETQSIEQWPRNIALNYPRPLTILKELPADKAGADGHSATEKSNSQNQAFGLQAFTLLPPSARVLNTAAARIKRNPSMKVLFHESWVQTIDEQNKALNIALHGGRSFDKHFELEGSIRLSRERYLHIETNLWLSRFTINMGQEIEPWPILPAQPYSPIHTENADFPAGVNITETLTQSDFVNNNAQTDFKLNDLQEFGSQFHAFLENQYVTNRVVTMRQHRKMRSNELHYLDHPLLGLLIQITPYEQPVKPQAAPLTADTPATDKETGGAIRSANDQENVEAVIRLDPSRSP